MPCLSVEELAALFDGVLPAGQAQRARRHLVACGRCANEIKLLDDMAQRSGQGRGPDPVLRERLAGLLAPPPANAPADRAPAATARVRPGRQLTDK